MTPKELAKELVDKYANLAESIEWTDKETLKKAEKLNDKLGTDVLIYWNELAKQSALIAVDEILKSLSQVKWIDEESIDFTSFFDYWQEVKQEIEKL